MTFLSKKYFRNWRYALKKVSKEKSIFFLICDGLESSDCKWKLGMKNYLLFILHIFVA